MPTTLLLVAVLAAPEPDFDVVAAAKGVTETVGHRGSAADRPENTLAGVRRAIEAGVDLVEIDARTTKDGHLVCLHDADLARTTNGIGKVETLTWAEIQKLDAGSRFSPKFAGECVPTVGEVLSVAKGKIGVLIDLKETGETYANAIAAEVRKFGDPKRTVIGVRSVEQAKQFRKLLPTCPQLGLIPTLNDIEPFAAAGVETIRLWPKWLSKESVARVRATQKKLHIGAGLGTADEVLPLLIYFPDSLSSDDPAQLLGTLKSRILDNQ